MNILGIFSTHGAQSVGSVKGVEAAKATHAAAQTGVGEVQDSVTLSIDAVRAAESTADIRMDKVNAIRAAIADGTYETADKLDVALDRLLERLG